MIKREFLPALRRAKIRKVTFHSLRHSNVSMRMEQKQNIVYISRQIGHASVKTTLDIYTHLIKDVNSEQAVKLDSILGFEEQSDSSSESFGRKMLEESDVGTKKGLTETRKSLILIGSGGRI